MLNNIIIGMCGVNFTLFGCEEKILSNVHYTLCNGDDDATASGVSRWKVVITLLFNHCKEMKRLQPGRGCIRIFFSYCHSGMVTPLQYKNILAFTTIKSFTSVYM